MPTAPRHDRPELPRHDNRVSACRRGYDRTWQRLALAVLSEEPLCRPCARRGVVSAAALVDHIAPLNDGGARLGRDNLQPLCVQCHALKTGEDTRRRRCP